MLFNLISRLQDATRQFADELPVTSARITEGILRFPPLGDGHGGRRSCSSFKQFLPPLFFWNKGGPRALLDPLLHKPPGLGSEAPRAGISETFTLRPCRGWC